MQFGTRCVIERAKDIQDGDVYIVNDPYLGGTHLMDVRFVKPFFYEGKLFAWLANTGHWPDTGGSVPGGFSGWFPRPRWEGGSGGGADPLLVVLLGHHRGPDHYSAPFGAL